MARATKGKATTRPTSGIATLEIAATKDGCIVLNALGKGGRVKQQWQMDIAAASGLGLRLIRMTMLGGHTGLDELYEIAIVPKNFIGRIDAHLQ
jgi:hypothetical protein